MKTRLQQSRTVIAALLALLLLLLGIGAVANLEVTLDPDLPLPSYTVRAAVPGMQPESVDAEVTRPLEEAIRALPGIRKIRATSRAGQAEIVVTAETASDDWLERLRETVADQARLLPGGVGDIRVEQQRTGDNQLAHYLLHGADLLTLVEEAEQTVRDRLGYIAGVSRVEVDATGVQNRIELVFRPSMLHYYGLTPLDVIRQLQQQNEAGTITPVGAIGSGSDQTTFRWLEGPDNIEALGRILISSEKGDVVLNRLVEIRDLRRSRADSVTYYHGEPAVAIRVYAAGGAQYPRTQAELTKAVEELNRAAADRYTLTLFEDRTAPIVSVIRAFLLAAAVSAAVVALFIGVGMKSWSAALLSLFGVVLGNGFVLGTMWLSGFGLDVVTLPAVGIISLLYTVTGCYLLYGYAQAIQWERNRISLVTKQTLVPILFATACLAGLLYLFLQTNWLDLTEKPIVAAALPVFLIGIAGLLLVYGWTLPCLAERLPVPSVSSRQSRLLHRLQPVQAHWRRVLSLRFGPYLLFLLLGLAFSFFFQPFVRTADLLDHGEQRHLLQVRLAEGTSWDEAVRLDKQISGKLGRAAEMRDFVATVSREEITYELQLVDRRERMRSAAQFEKEVVESLMEIVGIEHIKSGEERDTSSEQVQFEIKGPSLLAAKTLADQLAEMMENYPYGKGAMEEPFIYNIETSYEGSKSQVILRARPQMLAHYGVSEAEVRQQIAAHMGVQSVGLLRWDQQGVELAARYPQYLMQHPDQVRQIMIKTPTGAVSAADLVEAVKQPVSTQFVREDGQNVVTVTAEVNTEFTTAANMHFVLPLRLEENGLIPDGYTVLSQEELEKQKVMGEAEEQTIPLLPWGLAIVLFLLACTLCRFRYRVAAALLLLLPLLAPGTVAGLLMFNDPFNLTALLGIWAAALLLLVQAFTLTADLEAARSDGEDSQAYVLQVVRRQMSAQIAVWTAVLAAVLPMFTDMFPDGDFHASFAAVLLLGLAAQVVIMLYIVPSLYQAVAAGTGGSASSLNWQLLRAEFTRWWQNKQFERRERRQKQHDQTGRQDGMPVWDSAGTATANGTSRRVDQLTSDDFTPLSR
ncbi:efflux RND transporter permease subunit [Brevibacillus humidisoli]|uniref:efflux RND transporter permease subunit n=1 Tax=Brevibacillus humidisoli TaxID=2895522 RepID=UPI001E33B543|nr:efflux RND transporter permease subunit [Brevibacillus humidisoli]UFJ39786.1 efflux RND transporter permease subunit [Brevibacillus humidisoli]